MTGCTKNKNDPGMNLPKTFWDYDRFNQMGGELNRDSRFDLLNGRLDDQLKRRTRESRPKARSKVMISLTPASKDISAIRWSAKPVAPFRVASSAFRARLEDSMVTPRARSNPSRASRTLSLSHRPRRTHESSARTRRGMKTPS